VDSGAVPRRGLEVVVGLAGAVLAAGLIELRTGELRAAPHLVEAPAVGAAAPSASSTPPVPQSQVGHVPATGTPDAVASYTLHARLDADRHTIGATGTIRWRNTATVPTRELWFHLYLNAFKNDRSLYLRSPFGSGRGAARARDWGYVDVKRLLAVELDGVDLWPTAAKHSPNDPDDETDIRVPLPRPLPPGQWLTLKIEFEAKLPQIIERTGYSGSFHFAAQWFPKLARHLPDGSWAHFPFDQQAEFYADFGDYSVSLDVPAEMVVGATGRCVEESVHDGRRTVRQQAGGVHDFAWTAWDGFHQRRETIDAVDVRLLHPVGHERNAEIELDALRFALPELGSLFGRYPYPTLTVVHPPEHGRGAGGMEYPTLITTGGPWYAGHTARFIEAVTIHELAHQWFYGTIATDEASWPFLDEGLTSYAESVILERKYGAGSLIDWPALQIAQAEAMRWHALEHGGAETIAKPAASFSGFRSLGASVYARTATVLRTLANVYSEQSVHRVLQRFAHRHRFSHPGPDALLDAFRESLGEHAAEVLRLALFERGSVDFEVGRLRNVQLTEAGGVFDREAERETRERETSPEERSWLGAATVWRHGSLQLPVEIELVTADGTRTRRSWDGQGEWTRVQHRGPSPVVSVLVDPDRRIALDDNWLNNAVCAQRRAPSRTWERTTYVGQLLLGWLGP